MPKMLMEIKGIGLNWRSYEGLFMYNKTYFNILNLLQVKKPRHWNASGS